MGNYCVFLILFIIVKEKKMISGKLFILSGVMMLTPFFVNGVIISWIEFPDQSKYLLYTQEIRSNIFSMRNLYTSNFESQISLQDLNQKIKIPSSIFAISPLISIESFRSIGFLNRAIFVITLIFFIKKTDLPLYVKLFFILSPSLIIYSSVTLRDNLVLVILIWSLYFFLKKYYFRLIITLILLFYVKIQNFFIVIVLFYIISLFTVSKFKKFKFLNIIFLLTIILIGRLFIDQIFEIANSAREGLYVEQNGFYKSGTAVKMYEPLILNSSFFILWIKQSLIYIISPLGNFYRVFHVIAFMETVITYFCFYYIFVRDFKIKKLKNIVKSWVLFFIASTLTYSLFMFNDGMIARNRFIWLYFILIGYEIHKKIYLKKL
tara:strand:- start:1108 stop:2241 length:1134 start_codon:yes stop_codon:yes gene_type:complete